MSGTTGQLSAVQLQGQGINRNVTFVQVQKVNPTTKQSMVAKAAGSPSKQGQPYQVQKIIPISLATTMNQVATSTHATLVTSSSGGVMVRSIAPKMHIAPAPSVVQTVQVRNTLLSVSAAKSKNTEVMG
jgi:hypothetical protein